MNHAQVASAVSTPEGKPARKGYALLLAVVAALAGLLFGFDTAVINGALLLLKHEMALSVTQTEIAASALLVGCLLGAALAGMTGDRLGRKKSLLLAAVLFCGSSIAAALPHSLDQFAVARFFAGIAIGVASCVAPLYISEVSPARIRGRLVTLNQLAIVTGILAAYFVNWMLAGLGPSSWRWMFASAAIPSGLFFLSMLSIPESPRWLLAAGREAEALQVLEMIDGEKEAAAEADRIRSYLREEPVAFTALLRPGLRRPMIIAAVLAVLQQVTGINTVIYYGSVLFQEHAGSSSQASAIGANVAIGVMNFVCTILALFLIDRLGRKPLLVIGSMGMALSLGGLGLCFLRIPPPTMLILGLVMSYVGFFSISLGPVVWLLIAEFFPTRVRARASSVGTFCVWGACLLVTFTFLSLLAALGPAGSFWTYGCLCVVTFVFVLKFVPETKGRSLEEIEHIWRE